MVELFSKNEEFEFECPDIHGISTHIKPYKLAWEIDRSPYFSCQQIEDCINYVLGGNHICYEILDLDHQSTLLLIKNKGTEGFFYSTYKNFDFLLFAVDPDLQINNDSLTLIKAFDVVTLCAELKPPKKPENMNFLQLL